LKAKFKTFVETIDRYESNIAELKKERAQIIETNENIIAMKSKPFLLNFR
jgi:hypothetical protein